ncbi:hypothetical protein EDB83DRAFT_2502394 [Lactarius deliciosus]|nr:hypothetical protein EDB83DRAFT_2502394 [Lactarius deliciosus]
MTSWALIQWPRYVFFCFILFLLTPSGPQTTSVSPALARSAPCAAPLKSPPACGLVAAASTLHHSGILRHRHGMQDPSHVMTHPPDCLTRTCKSAPCPVLLKFPPPPPCRNID